MCKLKVSEDTRERPVETNMYYCHTRYYMPRWCRWLIADNINYLEPENINGMNLYQYCNNDPINNIDPSGHIHILISATISMGVSVASNVFSQMVFKGKSFKELDWADIGISAASGFISGLIPGSGFMSLVGQAGSSSFVENVLRSIVYGEEFSIVKVLKETVTQVVLGMVTNAITDAISNAASKIIQKKFIKAPNYSQYQHYFRNKGLDLSVDDVYKKMYADIKHMDIANTLVDETSGALFDFLTGLI